MSLSTDLRDRAGRAAPPRAFQLARAALAALTAVVVFGVLLVPSEGAPIQPHVSLDAAGLLVAAAMAVAACALVAGERRAAMRFSALAGAVAAPLFLLQPAAWMAVVVVVVTGTATAAMLADFRGAPRDLKGSAAGVALFLAPALAVPLVAAIAAAATSSLHGIAIDLVNALPARPLLAAALLAIEASLVVMFLDVGRRVASSPMLVCVGAGITLAVLVARLGWIASMDTLRVELFWPEAPFLVNALKLDAGQPLYGPPAALDTYTYSPLLDLAHHALLRPFGLELSIFANRALVVLDQALAAIVFVVALWPRLGRGAWRAWAVALLVLASFANLLAPAVHPDHPQLACFAVAILLALRGEELPRLVFWPALVLLTPIAVAFKLSGAGIALGLGLAFALSRRWKALLTVAASAALAALTVPLFDATLGSFRFYAIHLQGTHPLVWSRLWELALTPTGVLVVIVAVAFGWNARRGMLRRDDPSVRVALVTAGIGLASLPAYIKYAGRDNNLTPLFVGAASVLLLLGASSRDETARPSHPALALAGVLLACLLFRPPTLPIRGSARDAIVEEAARDEKLVHDEDAAGRRVLVVVQTLPWIDAGRRDVPGDRFHSAIELFYGGQPEADLYFSHIARGDYDTILVGTAQLRAGADLQGQFNARLRASLDQAYEADGAGGGGGRTIVFRRR